MGREDPLEKEMVMRLQKKSEVTQQLNNNNNNCA